MDTICTGDADRAMEGVVNHETTTKKLANDHRGGIARRSNGHRRGKQREGDYRLENVVDTRIRRTSRIPRP